MKTTLALDGSSLSLGDAVAAGRGERQVTLTQNAWARIAAGRKIVEDALDEGRPVYGVTTGVGSHKGFLINADENDTYSSLLVRAHGTRGPGRPAPPEVLRAALTIQLNLFATGATGVRQRTAAAFLEWLAMDDWPDVRLDHSVGASDLIALGQLADGFLKRFGVDALAPKEGLTFLNSNCVTLAQGVLVLDDLARLVAGLDIAAAFTLEGFRGQAYSWSEHSDQIHPQRGQQLAGAHLRRLLTGSRLWRAGEARYLQDPLSLRCVPQLHGACYQTLEWARDVWRTEINAAVDNPAVDLETGHMTPHGNMETTLLAVSLDAVRAAVAKAAEASGERQQKAQWPAFTGLPVGLASESDVLTSGVQFLNLDHLSAAYVCACKIEADPVAQHFRGQPSDGVEDVGGMAPMSVSKCERLLEAAWCAAAIETVVGIWAVRRRGLTAEAIGGGLRDLFDTLWPMLPIAAEGRQIFDIDPIVRLLRERSVYTG